MTTFNVTKFSTTTTNSLLTPCPSAYSPLLIEFLFTESPFPATLIRICVKTQPILHRQFVTFIDACTALPTTIFAPVVFGRAMKNECLALGTFATAFGSGYLATPGGSKTAAVQEANESMHREFSVSCLLHSCLSPLGWRMNPINFEGWILRCAAPLTTSPLFFQPPPELGLTCRTCQN